MSFWVRLTTSAKATVVLRSLRRRRKPDTTYDGGESVAILARDAVCSRVRHERAQRELRGCQGPLPVAVDGDRVRPSRDARRSSHHLDEGRPHASTGARFDL